MNHRSKLTTKQVNEMRKLRMADPDKWTYAALACEFNCGESTARDIVNFKTRMDEGEEVEECMTVFQRSEITRQKVLDYLNKMGCLCSVPEVAKALHEDRSLIQRTLLRMVELGEVRRKPGPKYSAIATVTVKAEVMEFLQRKGEKKPKTSAGIVSVTRNDPNKHSPRGSPDAMGSAGKASIGSGMYGATW